MLKKKTTAKNGKKQQLMSSVIIFTVKFKQTDVSWILYLLTLNNLCPKQIRPKIDLASFLINFQLIFGHRNYIQLEFKYYVNSHFVFVYKEMWCNLRHKNALKFNINGSFDSITALVTKSQNQLQIEKSFRFPTSQTKWL